MNAAALHAYLQQCDPPPLLLDVRQPWEFDICHIEGSRLIPMGQLPRKLAELDPGQETVVICHHGIRSRQVGHYMESQGFERIINLSGGVEQWAREVDPQMTTY